MGPSMLALGAMPVLSKATTSWRGQWATPASVFAMSEGAYQSCMGMSAPLKSWLLMLAPSALRSAWQALQWPRPRTR